MGSPGGRTRRAVTTNVPADMGDERADISATELVQLLNAVVDYAIFRLSLTGIVESWNDGAQRIKGYRPDEIIGRHFSILYTEADRTDGMPERGLQEAMQLGRFQAEGWRLRKDGSQFWAFVVIDRIDDASGRPVGFAKVTRDDSDRRELALAREKGERAQRMEQIGKLTGGVAHDFNNILTAVGGAFELLAPDLDERKTRILEVGKAAAKRGERLVAQLLSFARKQVLFPAPTDVNDLLVQTTDLVERALGPQIDLVCALDPRLPPVIVDPAHFQSAILNIIFNGRSAMPNGGTLTLRTKLRSIGDLGPWRAVVEVTDTGTGMTPEVKARATEPFFSTKQDEGGSGLGLSQVHGFVEQSNGEFELDSELGKGTTVRMLLPVADGPAVAGGPPPTKTAIILVDDDPFVLSVVAELLRDRGDLLVLTAASGREALETLEGDTPIKLILSDIVMPGLSGIELAGRARDLRPDVQVLLGSGYASNWLAEMHEVAGDITFLKKPYTRQMLNEAVDRVLAGHNHDRSAGD